MKRPMHQDDADTAVLRRLLVLLLMLLMFSLSSFPSVTAKCPEKCTCRGKGVNCLNQDLDRIPDRIPPATKTLGLNDNRISEVKNGVFSNLSKLQKLYLYNNTIGNIETGVFNNLMSLELLQLAHNNIHKLDLEMFKGLTKLNELGLNDNRISEVKNGVFSNLSKLQKLYLYNNTIGNIETGVFNNLMSLELLQLAHNNIHKLDLEMFKGLTKLNELVLNDNRISEVKNGAFSNLSKLQKLFLNNNTIENIETRVFNNLMSLELLNLADNKIHKLDLEMFKGLTKLNKLGLNDNRISEVKNGVFSNLSKLQKLYLYNNTIGNIETGVFNNLMSLELLQLAHNNIHKLDLEMFKGLTKLNELGLNDNRISEVKNGVFSNLSKLQKLYLYNNTIGNIETGVFNNLMSLELLQLAHNNIHKLDLEMFKGLTKLNELVLNDNRISEVKNGVFSNLSKLQKLFLNSNKIENIETGVFNNLMSLELLQLAHNNIHKLDLEMFKGLSKLNELSLSYNYISEVKNGAFSNLSKLQKLYLYNNSIENIETGVFNNLMSLELLNLADNKIHKLDLEMFKGLSKLNELVLNDNRISEVKHGAFSNLSKLQKLFLNNNTIENIETGVFNNLMSLELLNLADNKIHKLDLEMFKGLSKLNELVLNDNRISEVKHGAFSNLSKLQKLFLNNNTIENIETGVFNNLMSLELLNLADNKIHKLDLEMFKGLSKLNELVLNDNRISEVKNGAFSNLSKLQKLFLNNNTIENIESGVFNNLMSLELLNLADNKIHKLDLEMFKGLSKLNELGLNDNRISEVKNGAFSNLSKLQILYLYNNSIENIETGVFNNLMSLELLQLAHNNIHKLDLEMFKGLTKLNELYLYSNTIENIENGVFNNLMSLELLQLADNKIHKLDLDMFKGLTKLNKLHLGHNMLRKIPPEIFDSLTSLSVLGLDENPLTCDCDVIFYFNALKKNYTRYVSWDDDPSCHFPVEMSVKSLKDITVNVFHRMSPDVIVVPEIKKVSAGEQLRLLCKAVGDLEPFITWPKDEIDLELGQRVQVFQNNTLIISKVERTDGGQYKCVASNSLGGKSFEAMVNVNGTGIMCDRRHERRQAVLCSSENTDDKFNCSNGQTIEWSLLCDGDEDCSDGSDETKELCALYEFETNTTIDCGRVHNMKNQATSDEAHQSIIELAPWTFAVYRKIAESKFEFIQSASIIAPNIVISWGFYFCSIRRNEYDLVKIGPMVKLLDDYKLLTNVTMIYSTSYGNGDVYESNTIAVIVLTNKLPLSDGLMPICIDWFSNYNIRKKTQMRIIGFKFSGNNSEVKVIQYFTHYTTGIDKTLSIKFNKDSHISGGFPGSGLGILYSNSYFLTGILRNWSLRNTNNLTEVDTLQFLDIKYHIPWIRGILNKHVTVNSCILPTVEGVVYTYEDSNESLTHGRLIEHHVTIIENCEIGYHKVYPNSFRICQRNGKWKTVFDKLCLKMCPPLESDSLDIKCTHNGNYANCLNPSIPGSIAKPSCKPLYTAPIGHENEPLELLCQRNGEWDKKLYRCNPSCGKVYTINNGMIMGGKTATKETAPWNVGVYRIKEKKSTDYDLICGGSIISPNLVVSAAHCFWVKGMSSNRISVNDGQYKIAVGKYSRNITIIDNEFTRIMNVETVHLNEHYYGLSGFHADDIAIVVLQNRISFNIGVSPICVDWTGINTIPNGAVGNIVGWGKTEKNIASPILLEASLPYIDHSTCRKMYTDGFESYVTKDKFCAGSALGQGVHEGDSGAGLSFLHSNNLYYLTGVTSVREKNTNNSIAVFTEIKHHIGWISRLYNNKTL